MNPPAATFLNNHQAIMKLAEEYWDEISQFEKKEELLFPAAFRDARRDGYLSQELFIRVARWKSVRNTSRYKLNSPDKIRSASAIAFQAADDATAIQALDELGGVALRTASAILHWMRPDRFPILDYRVVAALGETTPASYEDIWFYTRTADRIRELARHHSIDLRTIDRALWTWDKRQSSKSNPRYCKKCS